MRPSVFALALGLGVLLAVPASANFQAKAKYSCYLGTEGSTKLPKTKGDNDTLIAACLEVAEDNPIVADYSLVFDSDTNALNVIRNCDSAVICALTSDTGCADAFKSGFNGDGYRQKAFCTLDFIDFGAFDVTGSMSCKQKESDNGSKFKFKSSCQGDINFEGTPCSIKVNTGKLFEESGSCPAPK